MPRVAPATVARALARTAPVGLALFPIGVVFGLLAGQSSWRPFDVLLLSLVGFSGSGQFAYLKLAGEEVRWPLIFAVICMMNLRYLPMALTAARGLGGGAARRAVLAHYVSDESYAVELPGDDRPTRVAVRLSILGSWVASTVLGCALATVLPPATRAALGQLSFFPASALLFALASRRVLAFIEQRRGRALWASLAGTLIAVGCFAVLGARYFWLPSTLATTAVMCFVTYREDR